MLSPVNEMVTYRRNECYQMTGACQWIRVGIFRKVTEEQIYGPGGHMTKLSEVGGV